MRQRALLHELPEPGSADLIPELCLTSGRLVEPPLNLLLCQKATRAPSLACRRARARVSPQESSPVKSAGPGQEVELA